MADLANAKSEKKRNLIQLQQFTISYLKFKHIKSLQF